MPHFNPKHLSESELRALADSSSAELTDAQRAQIELAARRTSKWALGKYSRRALIGFLILLAGAVNGFVDQNQQRSSAREASAMQRSTIVKSGNAVAVVGCNRDYRQALGVRRILDEGTRARIAGDLAAGDIDEAQAARAIARIKVNLKLYPLPDCRKVTDTITADPDSSVRSPEPFYPGGPDSPSLPKGSINDTSKDSSNGP